MSSKENILRLDDFPKAAEFVNAVLSQKYRVICYGGAIRGGKSFSAVGSLVLLHRMFPRSRSVMIRKDLEVLRKNMLPTCEKAIPKRFIKKFKGDPQFEWTFTNDSKSFFFAESFAQDKDYTRWNGLEVNWILLEQVEELQKMAFEKALERAGSYVIPNGAQPEPMILMTVNPNSGWVKEMIYDRWKAGTLPDKWLYIPALLTDNPNIPDNFIDGLKELKRINPIKYQRFVEGDWEVQDVVDGAFWKSFNYDKHVGEVSLMPNEPLHISFDENVNPYPATGIWQIENIELETETHYHVKQLHEIALRHPNNKLTKVAAEIDRWCRMHDWNGIIYLYGDATSDKEDTKLQAGYNYFTLLRKELEQCGYRVTIRKPRANPPIVMRAAFINSIYEMNYGNIAITINDECKESIYDYTQAQEGPDGKMLKPKVNGVEKVGHFSDHKCYFICEAFPNEFRKFQRGGDITQIGYEIGKRKKAGY